MKRYHIIKDGRIIGAMETREEALEMIEQRKKREPQHYLCNSEYWIIYGEEEHI